MSERGGAKNGRSEEREERSDDPRGLELHEEEDTVNNS